ncbi:MAG: hypothetical protein ACYS7Y_04235 [Planctomycetota bacterium]|jgi:hypothetical protein
MSNIPTTKGSLDSASLGLTQIRTLLRGMSTEEVHEALPSERAREIDSLIWEIVEEVEEAI